MKAIEKLISEFQIYILFFSGWNCIKSCIIQFKKRKN